MKRFITINGTHAWITEREDLASARHSAINICDHSKEIIVREISEITDYTKVISAHKGWVDYKQSEQDLMNTITLN